MDRGTCTNTTLILWVRTGSDSTVSPLHPNTYPCREGPREGQSRTEVPNFLLLGKTAAMKIKGERRKTRSPQTRRKRGWRPHRWTLPGIPNFGHFLKNASLLPALLVAVVFCTSNLEWPEMPNLGSIVKLFMNGRKCLILGSILSKIVQEMPNFGVYTK